MSRENRENNSSSGAAAGGGIGLCSAIFLLLLTLKLARIGAVAELSWWWVTAPLWGGVALIAAIFAVFLVVFAVLWLLDFFSGAGR